MINKEKIKVSVYIERDTLRIIDKIKQDQRRSRSNMMTEMLEDWITWAKTNDIVKKS